MKISEKGLKLIKKFEGCHLVGYLDPVGIPTVGYGCTSADKSITGKTIKVGMKISQDTADEWLRECLEKKYMPLVMKYDYQYHWNSNEANALLSFCYNIGSIKQLTADGTRSRKEIAAKMLEYNKGTINGKKYPLKGLTRRRKAERALFLEPVKKEGYPGKLPVLPERGYFKEGDGITTLKSYRKQIERLQDAVNWTMNFRLDRDGKYGKDTAKAVTKLQEMFALPPNGCYGNKCQKAIKNYKK